MIVDTHRQQAGARTGARHGYRERIGFHENRVDALGIAQRRRQDDAVDAGGEQFAHDIVLVLVGMTAVNAQMPSPTDIALDFMLDNIAKPLLNDVTTGFWSLLQSTVLGAVIGAIGKRDMRSQMIGGVVEKLLVQFDTQIKPIAQEVLEKIKLLLATGLSPKSRSSSLRLIVDAEAQMKGIASQFIGQISALAGSGSAVVDKLTAGFNTYIGSVLNVLVSATSQVFKQ